MTVLDSYLNFSNLYASDTFALVRFFDHLVVAYFFRPPCAISHHIKFQTPGLLCYVKWLSGTWFHPLSRMNFYGCMHAHIHRNSYETMGQLVLVTYLNNNNVTSSAFDPPPSEFGPGSLKVE